MDVQPAQTGVIQRASLLGQQHAVGGHRQVLNSGNGDQLLDQPGQILPHQRLAAGDAQLVDPQSGRYSRETLDLLERQNFPAIHKLDIVLRHAIKAADIAAVRHTDAQIVVRASEGVDQGGGHGKASIRSMGSKARRMISSESSTRGSRFARQSRSFSSVLSFMYGHSLQLQFSLATK